MTSIEEIDEFNRKKLVEDYNKILEKYNVKELSPKIIINHPNIPNSLRDAVSHWQVSRNMEDFRNLALIDARQLIDSGNLELIADQLGSDDSESGLNISGELISKFRTIKDEIAAALNSSIGKQLVRKYIGFISELQSIVKRRAEKKNKFEKGKALSNISEIPKNSKVLIKMTVKGHNFLVGLDQYLEYLKTGILPRRLYNLTQELLEEIEKNKIRLLSESEAVDLQNKILDKESEPSQKYNFDDTEKKDDSKSKNTVLEAIKNNYINKLKLKTVLEAELAQLKGKQESLNKNKKELAKSERPGSQIILDITKEYIEAKNKANEVEKKLQDIYRIISEIHSKFGNVLK